MTNLIDNADVALAAAGWAQLNIDVILSANGKQLDGPPKVNGRIDPAALYFWIKDHNAPIKNSVRTGAKSGLVALSIYTHGPETGIHALYKAGLLCLQCDTVIRNEAYDHENSAGFYHTALFYCGKDQFLETELYQFPGVFVRASGELISLPPEKSVIDPDLGLTFISSYESKDILAPAGITCLPDDLRQAIRNAEHKQGLLARRASNRSRVLPELFKPVAEGGRNNAMTRRAGYLLGICKLSADDTREVLMEINRECCEPPLDGREVDQIVKSIAKRHLKNG